MKLKLVEKIKEAKDTKSFVWEPQSKVSYLPGQFYYFTLPKLAYPDSRGSTRHFTLSSSPTEGDLLKFTTRIREGSGFKKTLDEMSVGDVIEGEGPNGTFVFDEKEAGHHVFIAGGIGITPFRSILKYVSDKKLPNKIYLIYSNSDSDFVFGKELKEIDYKNGTVSIEFFDSSKHGHLDELNIRRFISNWKLELGDLTFWLCGPPQMVSAIEQILGKLGVSAGRVRSEKFTGY